MTRDADAVAAAWGRLVGLAVDACQSHHAAHAVTDSGKKAFGKKERGGTDPDPQQMSFTVSPHQRCRPTSTGQRGVVVLNYEQAGQLQFDYSPVYLLPAGEPRTNAAQTATPSPMQLTAPGYVEVSIEPQLPRGLYVGELHDATGKGDPLLIYIDDLI
ncbi:MAG: hypothetical protein QOJ00_782 [Actinomycetota bacterium]|jgi:hypothetical protein